MGAFPCCSSASPHRKQEKQDSGGEDGLHLGVFYSARVDPGHLPWDLSLNMPKLAVWCMELLHLSFCNVWYICKLGAKCRTVGYVTDGSTVDKP